MRSARGKRRIWRAARRAAEQACDGDRVEETGVQPKRLRGEMEWRKERKTDKTFQQEGHSNSSNRSNATSMSLHFWLTLNKGSETESKFYESDAALSGCCPDPWVSGFGSV